ncbi:MAG: hypothetical protein C4520_11930 [Candidatus Abyssobacteria bacterium SURF_5]|uniref:Uncharacterized protein n=1 Tax=Abyssobacteria bacterium (strain SURF_5) TaxID=2093360 RepID=A0A3A4NH28_ABYX5|nr:MAG: hypothetical protein C4520_11930 [Candidatus Abyssubacteria bacterium SURF_5]
MEIPEINLRDVANILFLIAERPNMRNRPLPGDIDGDFDYWFDGGAVRGVTGTTSYEFIDGTEAMEGVLPWISLTIRFANGARVGVHQEHEKEAIDTELEL